MSTKGSWKRPYDGVAWGSNFERIFGKKSPPFSVTVPEDLPAVVSGFPTGGGEPLEDSYQFYEDEQGNRLAQLLGSSIDGNAAASNSAQAGSSPAAPAIYIDNATGA